MTMSDERDQLLERLKSKEFREALVDADIANGILFQLKSMLKERGWTQEELAKRAGTAQPLISKYLSGYENFSLKTLRKLASGFDVSLTVRFEGFSDLVNRYLNLDHRDLAIQSFSDDSELQAAEHPWTASIYADRLQLLSHGQDLEPFAATAVSSVTAISPDAIATLSLPDPRATYATVAQIFAGAAEPSPIVRSTTPLRGDQAYALAA